MDTKKVLVGFDFSPSSTTAVEHASHIAQLWQAELTFIHATTVPKVPPVHAQDQSTETRWKKRLRDQFDLTAERLSEKREQIEKRGVRTSQKFVDAYPDSALIDASTKMGAELVVVGWPKEDTGQWLRRRSIAERVVRHAEVPVLVARSPSPVFGTGYNNILVPTDFSDTAERALQLALTLIKPGGTIDVVHFWQSTPEEYPYFGAAPLGDGLMEFKSDHGILFQHASNLGRRLLEKFATDRANLVFSHADERPITGIVKRIEEGPYKLTVMGSHGRRGIRRWALGSVADATISNSSSSILVVPPGGDY